jgi:UDP-N-acetylglucosamine 2-epimerase (non-hydrolysing)
MPVDVCFVVGTRPNFVKAAPVYGALRGLDSDLGLLLVHTGQHYDAGMSAVFFDELGLPDPDVFLATGSGTLAEQTARVVVGVERVLLEHRPRLVVVAGDVNSTLAAALAAVKVGIPVAHIESGLRSFDWSMPEEHNRRLTDHVSSVLLAHSAGAVQNLEREGIDPSAVHLVGNTMIDCLLDHVEAARMRRPWQDLGVEPNTYGLVTLHRPTLVDDPALLEETASALCALAHEWPLVFPAHPRTLDRIRSDGLGDRLEGAGVRVCPALSYLSFLGLEAEARFILTDSGGVQEEASALGVPCFTLRSSTDRPITIERGTNLLLGLQPSRIEEIPRLLEHDRAFAPIPLWDGGAGARAAAVLASFLAEVGAPAALHVP